MGTRLGTGKVLLQIILSQEQANSNSEPKPMLKFEFDFFLHFISKTRKFFLIPFRKIVIYTFIKSRAINNRIKYPNFPITIIDGRRNGAPEKPLRSILRKGNDSTKAGSKKRTEPPTNHTFENNVDGASSSLLSTAKTDGSNDSHSVPNVPSDDDTEEKIGSLCTSAFYEHPLDAICSLEDDDDVESNSRKIKKLEGD